jgi:hypothetical protein
VSDLRESRLIDAGDRIVALISRCSDQATDEQRAEHDRFAAAIERIWNEAKNLS